LNFARSLAASVAVFVASSQVFAADPAAERGKYLVNIAGCNDCHTPGYFLGKPDMARFLGGSEVGFEMPGLGVFYGPNITPDKETGIGSWTDAQIIAALQKGARQKPAAGEEQGARSVRSDREADRLRH
jgi:mono/diheme cytochrome c family protein